MQPAIHTHTHTVLSLRLSVRLECQKQYGNPKSGACTIYTKQRRQEYNIYLIPPHRINVDQYSCNIKNLFITLLTNIVLLANIVLMSEVHYCALSAVPQGQRFTRESTAIINQKGTTLQFITWHQFCWYVRQTLQVQKHTLYVSGSCRSHPD